MKIIESKKHKGTTHLLWCVHNPNKLTNGWQANSAWEQARRESCIELGYVCKKLKPKYNRDNNKDCIAIVKKMLSKGCDAEVHGDWCWSI